MSATQQTAAAPQRGMRRIPFALESYQHPSLPLSAKHLINLMAEQEPDDVRTTGALVSTPWLITTQTLPTGPVDAINSDLPGVIYIAAGGVFYRLQATTGPVAMGTIGEAVDDLDHRVPHMTTIAVGPTAVVVCVPPNAWTADHTGTLNQLGGTFPGATSVTYIDGYFVFTQDDTSTRFFISGLFDPANFDALDFAFADGTPNITRRVVTHRGQLWLIGDNATEVWYDSGDADFPFRRVSGGVIPFGCVSVRTVARADGSVFWVGMDGIIYRSDGYKMVRISTHAIEAIMRQRSDFNLRMTPQALTYSQDGHTFYVVNLGTDRTLVYDCATKVWHDRSSAADGNGRWAPNAAGMATEFIMLGDYASGKIFTPVPISMPPTAGPDALVFRQTTLPTIWAGTNRAFCHRVEIEMEAGGPNSPGPVLLEWSDDGARTWSAARTLFSGNQSDTRHRVYTTRLGSFRQRTFRITINGSATLYAVDADISAGAS
jgi:hypothetical protein